MAFWVTRLILAVIGAIVSFLRAGYNGTIPTLIAHHRLRSNTKHRQDVQSLLKCTSKSALKHMESQLGCRNSVLLELLYFDPIRMTIIDPMHNLFLGSAKHITRSVFLNKGLLTKSDIDTFHKRVKNVQVPIKMGRIPSRIDSCSMFTAE